MVIMITTYVDFCSIYFTLDSDPVVFLLSPQQRLTIVPSVAALSVGRESGLPGDFLPVLVAFISHECDAPYLAIACLRSCRARQICICQFTSRVNCTDFQHLYPLPPKCPCMEWSIL